MAWTGVHTPQTKERSTKKERDQRKSNVKSKRRSKRCKECAREKNERDKKSKGNVIGNIGTQKTRIGGDTMTGNLFRMMKHINQNIRRISTIEGDHVMRDQSIQMISTIEIGVMMIETEAIEMTGTRTVIEAMTMGMEDTKIAIEAETEMDTAVLVVAEIEIITTALASITTIATAVIDVEDHTTNMMMDTVIKVVKMISRRMIVEPGMMVIMTHHKMTGIMDAAATVIVVGRMITPIMISGQMITMNLRGQDAAVEEVDTIHELYNILCTTARDYVDETTN
jgi:hypothetical protein